MSDRTNRDKGRKKEIRHKYKQFCGCWHCEDGSYKRKTLLEREQRKQKKRLLDEE